MAALTPASAAALARLRAYKPPPTQYTNVPLARRAAVLILLFADRRGDLRVVLTMRAAGMNTYAGHAALPGGRADALTETPFQTARREAWEEIGLPLQDAKLPPPFRVEHLCQMPANLARTELAVRPCVAFLAADRTSSTSSSTTTASSPSEPTKPITTTQTAEDLLIPRLSPHEVAAVFTAPFRNFLMAEAEESASAGEAEAGVEAAGFPAKWYQGAWTDWHESRWRMHNFYVPVGDSRAVVRAKGKGKEKGDEKEGDQGTTEERPRKRTRRSTATGSGGGGSRTEDDALSDPPKDALKAADADERFRVFGMTARILVDAARVAYDEEPRFEHNSHFGDEDMISRLLRMGRLSPERKKGDVLTREVLREAAKL
ncbi:Nudix domain-containing protein [Lasiodiplodia theobromae]|uniref:Peroxisomal coenzyme A diphosphatase 1 n=1 Tax=Lasiodiplodia theobromae TaxID=45133 RepID=A0A5N5DA04_9PEZI|nr:Nudix domain-containing protein [Lasiodiplodia theobromae]KAB2574435.1 Peroxisomal coenzyme A diphosphatase 1 [Lasiodiplodia theobromae]KAF4536890.1 Nudix domain-containing protein [Lasiodiplodia theobromae]